MSYGWAVRVAVLVAAMAGSTASGAFISDDFQTGTGNWDLSKGMTRVDIGGGQYVLSDSGNPNSAYSVNTTKLPKAIQIDMDLKLTTKATAYPMSVYFHSRTTGQPNTLKGYFLRYVDDYNTANDGLQLVRKATDYGTETRIGLAAVPVNLDVHHLRITDDGTGKIDVYWDNMTAPVISIDDSAGYVGADDTYMSLWPYYTTHGWFDNVVVQAYVPEPATLALLALAVPLAALRRRS